MALEIGLENARTPARPRNDGVLTFMGGVECAHGHRTTVGRKDVRDEDVRVIDRQARNPARGCPERHSDGTSMIRLGQAH